jgi:hypothetical protein
MTVRSSYQAEREKPYWSYDHGSDKYRTDPDEILAVSRGGVEDNEANAIDQDHYKKCQRDDQNNPEQQG